LSLVIMASSPDLSTPRDEAPMLHLPGLSWDNAVDSHVFNSEKPRSQIDLGSGKQIDRFPGCRNHTREK
jgi:hypothetical protein